MKLLLLTFSHRTISLSRGLGQWLCLALRSPIYVYKAKTASVGECGLSCLQPFLATSDDILYSTLIKINGKALFIPVTAGSGH